MGYRKFRDWRSSGRRSSPALTARVTASSCSRTASARGGSSTSRGQVTPRLACWSLRMGVLALDVSHQPRMTQYMADRISREESG